MKYAISLWMLLLTSLNGQLFGQNPVLQENNPHLYFKFLEGQDHGDALHLAVYDAFEKLFGSRE